jgi:N-acetyl-D-muramate 6-phosphate phosphatase
MFEAVFFDLDGTLADTAPDLGAALNRLLAEQGRAQLPHAVLRPHVSAGARGLLRIGFGLVPEDPAYPSLHKRFLDIYENALCHETALFAGMGTLLDALEANGIAWGVVTNKPERFTLPLMAALGLATRAAAVVGGDTTARAKPDPLPLLHACSVAGVSATASAYVGDDLRDIQAGRAAGMVTFAAAWGYLGDGLPIGEWGADRMIDEPTALLADIERGWRQA